MAILSPLTIWRRRFTPAPVRHIARYERVLGTSLDLQVVAETLEQCCAAEAIVLEEIDRLEAIFSAYRPDSELRRWQRTHGSPESVSTELATVLHAAEEWRQRTDNAFHPAVEALTQLWRAGAEQGSEPDVDRLLATVEAMRSPLWEIDTERQTARRLTELPVTLNAIAKGYIIDRASFIAMQQPGIQTVLVNIGGDIRHHGSAFAPVHVADPFAPEENAVPITTLRLRNHGIATSGNYRRGFQVGERWRSHLLDPRTGYPVEQVVSASVVAESALLADVLTTAFSVMRPEESLSLADQIAHVSVLLVSQDRQIYANARWRELANGQEA